MKELLFQNLTDEQKQASRIFRRISGGTVFCNVCQEEILQGISSTQFNKFLTVKEQEHLATEEHRANVTLMKLSGEKP